MADSLPIVPEPLPSDRPRGPEPEVLPLGVVDPDRPPQGDAHVARQWAADPNNIDPQAPVAINQNKFEAWAEKVRGARAAQLAARNGSGRICDD